MWRALEERVAADGTAPYAIGAMKRKTIYVLLMTLWELSDPYDASVCWERVTSPFCGALACSASGNLEP
eukprot:COSAG02_NODE_7355_length_3049_cov_4.730169_2_plen_69_part_00